MQVPEQDAGASFAGRMVLSASRWVPKELVTNKDALLRASCVIGYSRTEDITIQLAEETEHHIKLPAHLPISWLPLGDSENLLEGVTWEAIRYPKEIEPRDDQQRRAWAAFSEANYGVLNLSCGKGKTVLALKKIAQRAAPALVLVNNGALAEQWASQAKAFLGATDDDIGYVQGDRQQWDRPLVIGMLQTVVSRLASLPIETRMRFGTIIWDECHHTSAATYVKTADLFFGARYGLTATPTRTDRLEMAYFAHLGPIFYSDNTSDINAEVAFKRTGVPEPAKSLNGRDGLLQLSKLYKYLYMDKKRNKMIVEDARELLAQGRKVLLLSHSIAHLELLLKSMRKELPTYKVGCVHGATKVDTRLHILSESNITLASFTLAKEGLDVPSMDTLLLTTPFKDAGAFKQCRGRVERAYPMKKTPVVVVYEDENVGPAKAMCNTLRKSLHVNATTYKTVATESSARALQKLREVRAEPEQKTTFSWLRKR